MNLIGHRIGNFALTRVLGTGGMGIVYLAEHAFLERRKAVKILLPEAAESPTLVRRFFDEAMAASACQHEHIVRIEDCGTLHVDGEPFHYIEMEYLDGCHVGEAMRPPRAPTERFEDCERVVQIAIQATGALQAAHARGVIHRDLKPENLFLTRRGARGDFLKVLDFGIARLTGELAPGARTKTGAVIGTPEYMSPEQARGLHPDGKSDVFSLGVVLYRMVTGRLPFRAETFPLLAVKIATEVPTPVEALRPDAPRALCRAIEVAMAKAPDERPTMRELADLLTDGDAAPRPIAVEATYSVPSAPTAVAAERAPTPLGPPDDTPGERPSRRRRR